MHVPTAPDQRHVRDPFFFQCPPATGIFTLSLHDALPIFAIGKVAPSQIDERTAGCLVLAAQRAAIVEAQCAALRVGRGGGLKSRIISSGAAAPCLEKHAGVLEGLVAGILVKAWVVLRVEQ